MYKFFCKLLLIFILVLSVSTTLEAATLHKPQGRIGIGYKPEKYNPYLKTNVSSYELERINRIIKQQELEKKKLKDDSNTKTVVQKEIRKLKPPCANQQIHNTELVNQQDEKNRIKQEKATLLAKHKAEMEKLKQEKNALIKEQQRKEDEAKKQAQQVAATQIIEEQHRKNDEYLHKQAEKERVKEEKSAKKNKFKEEKKESLGINDESNEIVNQKQLEKERLEQEKYDMIAEKKAEKARLKQEKLDAKAESQKKTLKASFFKKIENDKNANNEVIKADDVKNDNTKQVSIKKIPQDPQTKKIVKEISNEISQERAEMLEELSTLWVSAVQKSDTVYFAIMKLSNPNGEEVNKNGIKKILEPIISAAPLVGQAFVNPALTAGSVIGSNFMGTMMNDSATKRLSKVNDADLVILARAIDELQETLLMNYMAYKNALKEYELAIKITQQRKKSYEDLNSTNSPNVILANTFYAEALDNQYKARQDFLMKRVVLEQMVGAEALNEIEQKKVEADKNNGKTEKTTK